MADPTTKAEPFRTPAEIDLDPKDPGFGKMYGRSTYVTTSGIVVWMWRKGQRVRFYDARGVQHGPEHANVVPATYWAAAHMWYDPDNIALSFLCIMEFRKKAEERSNLRLRARPKKATVDG